MDGGALRMAHLLTCLEDPPFAQTELHKGTRSELVHAQLADPRWIATHLAFLKDVEQIGDKTNKYVRPSRNQETEETEDKKAAPKPKFRPRRGKRQTPEAADEA